VRHAARCRRSGQRDGSATNNSALPNTTH
jgi:hypothetical protein